MSKKKPNIAGTLGEGTRRYLQQGLQNKDEEGKPEEVQPEEQEIPKTETQTASKPETPVESQEPELQETKGLEDDDDTLSDDTEEEEEQEEPESKLKKGKRKKERTIADTIHFKPGIYKQLRKAWMQRKIKDPGAKKWHIVNEALELYFQQDKK